MQLKGTIDDPRMRRRYRAERRFQGYAVGAVLLALAFLVIFFADIISQGYSAFYRTEARVTLNYTERVEMGDYRAAVSDDILPVVSRGMLRNLPREVRNNPDKAVGTSDTRWMPVKGEIDQYRKGHVDDLDPDVLATVKRLEDEGKLGFRPNWAFFVNGDSKLPELAGIGAAAVGSVYLLGITLLVAFPIGVMTAVYLEEFARDNWFTQTIEVNINNLAAVPSIIYGLLGLAVFINFFGVPRSSALAGGLTIGLMTLPIIIISTRAALRAVPDPVRLGAFAMGCTRWQVVRDHVLPPSLPGILTGTIIGLAQAMGETAPLILVGLIAFIQSPPADVTSAATVLPAQVFTWFGMPQTAFEEKASAGIIVLLAVLLSMNAAAVLLRRRMERRW
jgi:phosphate transport system permease protein